MKKLIVLAMVSIAVSLTACVSKSETSVGVSSEVILPVMTADEPTASPQSDTLWEHNLSPSGKPWFNEDPFQRGVFWLGMTIDEGVQAFNENGLVTLEEDGKDNILSTNNGREVQELYFNTNGQLDYLLIMVRPHFRDDYTGDTSMCTEKGIRLGDTFEKVEELYGTPHRVENEDDRHSVVYSYKMDEEADYYLLFVANGLPDVVDAIIYNVKDDTFRREDEMLESLLNWTFAYDDDGIVDAKEYTFPNGDIRLYESNEYILWLEDTFVSTKVYELPTGEHDMELWLPISALPELENYIANGTEYKGRMEEVDGEALVESGEAAYALGVEKATIPGWGERGKAEYPDYTVDSVGYERPFWFAPNPILYIGKIRPLGEYPPNYDEVLETLKDNMNQAYSSLNNVLDQNDFTSEQLEMLRERIETTDFVTQYDRFFVFTGPYCMLWDNVANNAYFYTFAYGIGGIWRADFNDPELFVPMYFAD